MPELPEVETVKRVLYDLLTGRRINDVIINNDKIIAHPEACVFRESLIGRTFTDIGRRGKYLLFPLDNGAKMIVHLRMTGCLYVCPDGYPIEKHTHILFHLDGGDDLRFEDIRRFGRFWFFGNDETDDVSGVSRLGLEPDDKNITAEYLADCWGHRKIKIKQCLLEQDVICGLGNIYSDEILFSSGVRPDRSADSLSGEEWNRLSEQIPLQIAFFTEKNIESPEEYLASKGMNYRNTPYLRVYGRSGHPCLNCGTALEKTVIGGRHSVLCPNCQK